MVEDKSYELIDCKDSIGKTIEAVAEASYDWNGCPTLIVYFTDGTCAEFMLNNGPNLS